MAAKGKLRWEERIFAMLETAVLSQGAERFPATTHLYAAQRRAKRFTSRAVPWVLRQTPIERAAFDAIRCYGLPMMPEYPVGPRFVDFGDPIKRIAIECDGRSFHTNPVKEARRDLDLARHGWTVFHASGQQCRLPEDDPLSIDGLVREIAFVFYGRRGYEPEAFPHMDASLGATWRAEFRPYLPWLN